MKTYIRPEIKYLSIIQEQAVLLASEKVFGPDEESEETAQECTIFDEMNIYKKTTTKSVWE